MKMVFYIPDPVEVSVEVYGITTRIGTNYAGVELAYDIVHTDKGRFVKVREHWMRLPNNHASVGAEYSFTGKCGCWACFEGIRL